MYPQARFLISAAASAQFPRDAGAEVAIVGRSNAGKSSAINAILGRRSLARTSKTPGRTRLLNFFEVAPDARLIDLPGYGYAAGPREDRAQWAPLIDELRPRQSLRGLLLIVDARRGMLEGDRQLVHWAQSIDRPVHVLFSKSDLIKRAEGQQLLRAHGGGDARDGARDRGVGQAALSVQLFSAHKGLGLNEARGRLDEWLGIGGSHQKESPGSTGE
ncbi:MAG TPA: ribosome biogenesis GTP-binding protein YihA/YsxC [Steroidobacteraceae bacterium]|jgi:GTP-binding protein